MLLEFFGRFKRPHIKAAGRDPQKTATVKDGGPQSHPKAEMPRPRNNACVSEGFFTNANDFVINQPNMLDMRDQRVTQNIVNNINTGTTVLEHLLPHICPEAAVDSSARHPPPLCHPGTRKRIRAKLEAWIDDSKRQKDLIWLTGPAGTGKSAVAQTFAELCKERRRLGAAFFFSRPNERHDPKTVIPTLAYQLAVHCPEYRSLLTHRIAHDLTILQKTPRTQLRNLIVEPFSIIQMESHRATREPFLVLLDGLDECTGINAQCEFVEMIGEVIRLKRDLPLLWLISSRPEPHLKYLFLRTDFSIDCDKEELLIDAETREDVDLYLRDGFRDIRKKFWDVVSASWPLDDQLLEVLNIASGLFVLAEAILRYVSDIEYGNPMGRLATFLAFMKGANRAGVKNPLEALDLFYSRILSEIPDDIFLTTRRILAVFHQVGNLSFAPTLCSFLDIDQTTFYNALRKLHSVLNVPSPETATETQLQFHHASFQDYLRDPTRSGKFMIDEGMSEFEFVKSCLFWYKIDLEHFHADNVSFNGRHDHGILPGLKWTPPDNREEVSCKIAEISEINCWWDYDSISNENVEDLLFQLHDFNFQYINIQSRVSYLLSFMNWLWKLGPRNTLLRTGPCNDFDLQLLNSVKAGATELGPLEPATFPLRGEGYRSFYHSPQGINEYFFIGHGDQTCLFLLSGSFSEDYPDLIVSAGGAFRRVRFLREEPSSNRPSGCIMVSIELDTEAGECKASATILTGTPAASGDPIINPTLLHD